MSWSCVWLFQVETVLGAVKYYHPARLSPPSYATSPVLQQSRKDFHYNALRCIARWGTCVQTVREFSRDPMLGIYLRSLHFAHLDSHPICKMALVDGKLKADILQFPAVAVNLYMTCLVKLERLMYVRIPTPSSDILGLLFESYIGLLLGHFMH